LQGKSWDAEKLKPAADGDSALGFRISFGFRFSVF